MTMVIDYPIADWNQQCSAEVQKHAQRTLEEGNVLFFPSLGFSVNEAEVQFLSPNTLAKSKNISLDVVTGKLGGTSLNEVEVKPIHTMMQRFATYTNDLMLNLLPHYNAGLVQARTSFRPVEIVGRSTSWRKDDTRLHVDSFPSSPVQGRRILRVFCNVNPHGRSRLKALLTDIYLPYPPLFGVAACFSNCFRLRRVGEAHMTTSCCSCTTV